ncbi:hypothetical protein D3C73_1332180 [compost metagenome]
MFAFHQRCKVPHVGTRPAEPGTGHIRGHLLRQRLERCIDQIVRVQQLFFVQPVQIGNNIFEPWIVWSVFHFTVIHEEAIFDTKSRREQHHNILQIDGDERNFIFFSIAVGVLLPKGFEHVIPVFCSLRH